MLQEASPIEKEFLVKSAILAESPVRFHGLTTTAKGSIIALDREKVSIRMLEIVDGTGFSLFEHLTGYFDCHGKTYAFHTIVREINKQIVIMDAPARLMKSLQRRYIRVKAPKTINTSFSLANEEIRLDYPECPEYLSFEDEAQFERIESSSIFELINSFKKQAQIRSTGSTIIMFRTQKPTSFEEELVSKTGKVLYIPSTSSGLPKNDPYPEGRIITERLEESFEAPDYFLNGSRFDKILLDKKIKGIVSEIWCPILYYQYVVGYIYLVNRENTSFDIAMIDFAWEFSRVLAFQLQKTGYFRHETQKKDPIIHKPHIIDMCPGGMLISMPKSDLRTPVKEGCIFKIAMNVEDKEFTGTAKVLRRYEDALSYSFGTSFMKIAPDHLIALYEKLYHHPYSIDNPLAYERKGSLNFTQSPYRG